MRVEPVAINQEQISDKRLALRDWLRFIIIFAIILMAAEFLLLSNSKIHNELAYLLEEKSSLLVFNAIALALSNALFTLFILISLFALIEWRYLKFNSFKERYSDGLIYSSIALSFSILIQAAEYYAFEALGVKPLIDENKMGPFLIVFPFIYLLILGFMEYWVHRALHHYEFLWRFHSIHHQIEHLNAARSYSHIGETFLYLLFITTPLILLVDLPQNHIALVTTFYIISNYYMHSDSKSLSFPAPLRHIFADNIYHHYHHSTDIQHFGKNYASFLSIFDRIFGTQYMPKEEKFPVTGIDDYRPIASIYDYISRPFQKDIQK